MKRAASFTVSPRRLFSDQTLQILKMTSGEPKGNFTGIIPGGGNMDQQFRWTSSGILQALRSNSDGRLANRYIEVGEKSDIAASEYDDLNFLN